MSEKECEDWDFYVKMPPKKVIKGLFIHGKSLEEYEKFKRWKKDYPHIFSQLIINDCYLDD